MDAEKTCANCENLFKGGVLNMPVAACKLTDFIVPHQSDHTQATFWRVPLECPLVSGVKKSEKQAPKKDWVIKQWSEFK